MFARLLQTHKSSETPPPVIGLPRALLYHKYAPLWTTFFRELRCQVVVSPNTNRPILERGVRQAIDENCLAVKIFLGHVDYLLDKADYIFIPRIEQLHRLEKMCVKLFALGDIARNTFPGIRILEYNVNEQQQISEKAGMIQIGLRLNPHRPTVLRAIERAHSALAEHNRTELIKQNHALEHPSDCRVLLVAHAYITHDALMGKIVTQILKQLEVDVILADVIDVDQARSRYVNISQDVYWTYSKELLGGIDVYKPMVDGIVFLMAFPCGPDALMSCLCQLVIDDIPLCVLNMDELQGDAGLKTRLESFVDILRLKKEKSA